MVSQTNYTLTYCADHHPKEIFHDKINRYLSRKKLQPKLVWEQAKGDIQQDKESYLIFDDTIKEVRSFSALPVPLKLTVSCYQLSL